MKRVLELVVVFMLILSSYPNIILAENEPIQILDYSKSLTDGNLVVKVKIKNSSGMDKRIGVAAIGFDGSGSPIEARGASDVITNGSEEELDIIMFAGDLIKDIRLVAGKGETTGRFEVLGYGMYYDAEMESYVGTMAIENCTGVETNVSGALIGMDKNANNLEVRGNYANASAGQVASIEFFMKSGSSIKSLKPVAGTYKTDKSIQVLGYGSYYDATKRVTISTMAIENCDTVSKRISGSLVGYGADGSALEARCSDISVVEQGCSSFEVEMSAGKMINEVRPVLPKGKDDLLAFGSYYDEIKQETLTTVVFENSSDVDKAFGGAVLAYDDAGNMIEVHGDTSMASSKSLVEVPLTFDAGKDISKFKYSLSNGSMSPEIVGCGMRLVDGKNIINAVIDTGAAEQTINMKVFYYDSNGAIVAEKDLTGYGKSGEMAELFGVNTIDFTYDKIDTKYYDSNGTEITKYKNVLEIENSTFEQIKEIKPVADFKFEFSKIDNATTKIEILEALNSAYSLLTTDQKTNSKLKEDSLRFAEYAIQKITKTNATTFNNTLKVSASSIKTQIEMANSAKTEVLDLMNRNSIENNREVRTAIELDAAGDSNKLSVELNKDLLNNSKEINKIKVITGRVEIAIDTSKLSKQFTDKSKVTISITTKSGVLRDSRRKTNRMDDIPASGKVYSLYDSEDDSLDLEFTDQAGNEIHKLDENIEISIPAVEGDVDYQCVFKTDGADIEAVGGRYNEANESLDVETNEPGTYYVKENRKTFKDIASTDMKLKKAIEVLASKGIINGKTDEEFQPYASINRSEFSTLIVKALYMVNDDSKSYFNDVPESAWFYKFVSSARQGGLINGYEDNTFRGDNIINNQEIIKVCAAVLNNQGGFYFTDDEGRYLGSYGDANEIPDWARKYVALASREGIVVMREDGLFVGGQPCTRGDAALALYRLFERI